MGNFKPVLAWIGRSGKRIAVSVIGFGLVVLGIVLLPLPGPGMLVIFAGLAVLGSEYAWARRALDESKRRAGGAVNVVRGRLRRRRPGDPGTADPPDAGDPPAGP